MASDVADLRTLLEAATRRPWTDDGYRVRGASDDGDPRNGPLVYEYKQVGENGEANAALTVAVVNALPALLDRVERMEAELRDLSQRAEAAQCALVDEQIAASEARRLAWANDRLRQVAEGERDLLRVQVSNATELTAQIATVTAERDAAAEKCDTLRSDLDEICGYASRLLVEAAGKFPVREVLGAADGEMLLVAARRVVRERDVATASVRQLRADVELATAQRDAETCRADNTETERDEARAALAAVTAERDDARSAASCLHHIVSDVASALNPFDGHPMGDEVRRVTRERDVLRTQQAPLLDAHDALVAAAQAAGWTGAGATGEELVAWVRRGALREALAVARAEPGVPDGATQADFNAAECAGRIAAGIENLMGGE